ncbi:hypothetical protein JM946_17260 [Steroidobacter sp. S1-65]|uniref:Uncharacterized protein n=1 Tax=Steroidobacter gossypii TaxID=2805490 RepID=A0ABS1WZS3_9GAMM|nr:hypothetical protein [Steroidobacter gossypii]MBM0106480.1 hypothetical protein [Steroidobacter gossypii]
MKPLRYILYRSYKTEARATGFFGWGLPLLMTSIASGLNVLALMGLAMWAIGTQPRLPVEEERVQAVLFSIVAVIFALLYRRWIASGRYVRFAKEFEPESRQQQVTRTILLYLYGAVTLLSPALVGYLIRRTAEG